MAKLLSDVDARYVGLVKVLLELDEPPHEIAQEETDDGVIVLAALPTAWAFDPVRWAHIAKLHGRNDIYRMLMP